MDLKYERPKIKRIIFKRPKIMKIEGRTETGIIPYSEIESSNIKFNVEDELKTFSDCIYHDGNPNAFCIWVLSSPFDKPVIYTIGNAGRPYEGELNRRYVNHAFFTKVGNQCGMRVRLWTPVGDTSGDLKYVTLNRYDSTFFPGEGFRIYGGWVGASFERTSSSFDCPGNIDVVIGTGFY